MPGLDYMNYYKIYRNSVGFRLFKSDTNQAILGMLVQDKRQKTKRGKEERQ